MNVMTGPAAPTQIAAGDPDWWRGAVIYQIYPRSFQDSNGDGIGDLAGITKRLEYVADLGVDAIWLSPFFTSPMKDFGYDVADYCDVDPIFGTLADFDAMVAEAHRLGLKVIIDQVLSHTSDLHPWFAESRASRDNPKADWYVWADPKADGTAPNNWLSVFGGSSWSWDTRRSQYYLHNFLAEQPDLNFHTLDVQMALLETIEFWLNRGVDGFRLDTTNFFFHDKALRDNPPADPDTVSEQPRSNPYRFQKHVYDKNRPEVVEFLQRLRGLLDRYPGTTTVGEIGEGNRSVEMIAHYTGGGDRLHMAYTFDLLGANFSAAFFRTVMQRFEAVAADGWPCWAFSNHDVIRHATRWAHHAEDPDRLAGLMNAMLCSLRGTVCLYQGEELGLTEAELAFEDLVDPPGIRFWPEYKGRDGCRTPMAWEAGALHAGFTTERPWLPVSPEHLARAADRQRGDEASLHAQYRRFMAFRKRHPALLKGAITFLDCGNDVLAFRRDGDDDAIVCLFNLSSRPVTVDLPGGFQTVPLDGHGFAGTANGNAVTLAGHDAFFGQVR